MRQDWIDSFIRYLATERGLSPLYQLSVCQSLDWLGRYMAPRGLSEACCAEQDIVDFLAWMATENNSSPSSRRIIQVHLRVYFRFLARHSLIAINPAAQLPSPKPPRSLPHSIPKHVVDQLLAGVAENHTLNPADPYLTRDLAILELLYASGLRVSELTSIKLADIDTESRWLRVLGKGSKIRELPFGEPAANALRQYLATARPQLVNPRKTGFSLFIGRAGTPLTRERIRQIISLRAMQAGIEARLHPHLFRHACATHLLDGGADLRVIQEFLGHASVTTTEIYTQVDRSTLVTLHRQLHPRGNIPRR